MTEDCHGWREHRFGDAGIQREKSQALACLGEGCVCAGGWVGGRETAQSGRKGPCWAALDPHGASGGMRA